ncbi:unnamed protein product [Candida verbasci]|uniref:Pantoate--beta-alanine ligase n=1 Tax=Candida verbasci TaxID=1227364 RepID=A0A9W4XJ33_9ASCO|nr:unnamed protein product [Candida verbasci]
MTNSIKILRSVQQVRQWRLQCKSSVGFIPTMGALHAGHCSLIKQSIKENDFTVVSIFVNPSQFGPNEDLDNYPRTLEKDLEILQNGYKVDAVFVPKVSEIYPSGIVLDVNQQRGTFVSVHGCSEQLEGVTRPQFFRGVATVVTKLLNVVQPSRIYFGQKDAQQCVVIKNLVKDLLINTEVRIMPTLRESNGLAMSSRNEYLSKEIRMESSQIYKALKIGEEKYRQSNDSKEIIDTIRQNLKDPIEIEYIAISHPDTLEDLEIAIPGAIVSIAVKVPKEDGKARLIDNIIL